jgi:hypothetical protein
MDEHVASLRAQEIALVLRALARHEAAVKAGRIREPAEVVLHLTTGRDVQGRLLDLSSDRGGGQTCLVALGGHRQDKPHVAYVAASHVAAVTVVGDDQTLRTLAGEEPPAPKGPALPEGTTRLGLLRHARDVEARVTAALGTPVALELAIDDAQGLERGLDAFYLLIDFVAEALEMLAADELSKQALASAVKQIAVRHGSGRYVTRQGDRLVIETGSTASGGFFADMNELKEAIERVF